MQWSKVSAVAALLLLLGGCMAESEGAGQDPTIADPNRALTLEEVDHQSQLDPNQAASVVNPGQGDEVETTDNGKPQPDPWKNATSDPGSGLKPQPDPWSPDNSRSNSVQ